MLSSNSRVTLEWNSWFQEWNYNCWSCFTGFGLPLQILTSIQMRTYTSCYFCNWPLRTALKQWLLGVQFSCSVVSDSLRPCGLQHARLPCPSSTARACSSSCPSSQWCHPAISSSVIPFSFHLQSFPASGSFPVSQFFASGGQSIGWL